MQTDFGDARLATSSEAGRSVRKGKQAAAMGQYFTPESVVSFMIDLAAPKVTDTVLDPFCGPARFLCRALDVVRAQCGANDDEQFREFAERRVHGIEQSEDVVRTGRAELRHDGGEPSNLLCADAFANFADLTSLAPESFDLVLTNPPFGAMSPEAAAQPVGHFELAARGSKVRMEIIGLERSVQFLRPGGTLAIILPNSVLANKNTVHVRKWMMEKLELRAVIGLPVKTFYGDRARPKTSIVFARKWPLGQSKSVDHAVYVNRITNIDTDQSGKLLAKSDLDSVKEDALRFLNGMSRETAGRVIPLHDFSAAKSWDPDFFQKTPPEHDLALSPFSNVALGELFSVVKTTVKPQREGDREFTFIGLENVESGDGDLTGELRHLGETIRTASKIVRPGYVLYGRLRPNHNRVHWAEDPPENTICSAEFLVLVPNVDKVRPAVLRALLSSELVMMQALRFSGGAGIPRIYIKDFSAIRVPLPPMNKQLEFEQQQLKRSNRRLRELRRRLAETKRAQMDDKNILMGFATPGGESSR